MPTDSLSSLARLKQATHDLHRTLDHASGMTRLMSPDLQLMEYSGLLTALHGIYALLEPAMASAERAVGIITPWQPKTGWLLADLQALADLKGTPVASASAWDCAAPPPAWRIASKAELAGCLYVLEGASLGGQVIVKRLTANLGSQAHGSLRFFSGYGASTHARWAATCQAIEGNLSHELAIVQACGKAREVFQLFIDRLQPAKQSACPLPAAGAAESLENTLALAQ